MPKTFQQFLFLCFLSLSLLTLQTCNGDSSSSEEELCENQNNCEPDKESDDEISGPSLFFSLALCDVSLGCYQLVGWPEENALMQSSPGDLHVVFHVDGVPTEGITISFTLENEVGELETDTAITNAHGAVIVGLFAGSVAGEGMVTAIADTSGISEYEEIEVSLNFFSDGDE